MLLRTITIALILFSFDALSQELNARILASKGKNINLNSGQKIKTGDLLYSRDTILMVEDGYLGLMLSNGRTFELRKPGIQPMTDYFLEASKTVVNPCMEIWREKGYFDPIPEDSVRITYCAIDYQVELDGTEDDRTMSVYPSIVRMDFRTPQFMDSLVISFYNICDEVTASIATDQNFLEFDISAFDLSNIHHNTVLFNATVYNYGMEYYSPTYGFEITDEDRTRRIRSDILNMDNNEERRAYFEQNNLPLNANFEQVKN
ncbi:MAG: hypothetical protein RIC35_12825 [Marinoscillum sp.]